jgi:hypothetical protein
VPVAELHGLLNAARLHNPIRSSTTPSVTRGFTGEPWPSSGHMTMNSFIMPSARAKRKGEVQPGKSPGQETRTQGTDNSRIDPTGVFIARCQPETAA